MVRIGVVLAEDAMAALDVGLHDDGYRLIGPGGQVRDLAAGGVRVTAAGGNVVLTAAGAPAATEAVWQVEPRRPRPTGRGEGVLLRGLVAGRGFHWQKRVDQSLAGRIEFRAAGDFLVVVNELPLEAYLASVITSEMSSACPPAFLRAQCITARSWLLAFTEPKHEAEPFDRCNDDCCQRYQGTGDLSEAAIDAAESTRGLVLTADGGRLVVDANYSKSCGGVVEIPEHVWGVHKPGLAALVDAPAGSAAARFMPVTEQNLGDYLAGDWIGGTDVFCSPAVVPEDSLGRYLGRVDEAGRYFRWQVRHTHDELLDLIKSRVPGAADLVQITDLVVARRGVSGRATEVVIGGVDAGGRGRSIPLADQYRIRQALHRKFLYSSAFAVEIDRSADGACRAVTLRGAGWGHGAGFCQIGGLGMALRGYDHEAIVRHYFPGAELARVYGG